MKYLLHRIFYPLIGFVTSVVILAVLAYFAISITFKRFMASLAVGFTLGFILSSIDDDDIMKSVFGFKREMPTYADAKGQLKRGKRTNTLITAIVDLISGVLLIMEA